MPDGLNTARSAPTEPPGDIVLRGLWAVSADLLCVLDLEGVFLASNPAWQATLGWSAPELQAASFLQFVHPDDRADTLACWATVRGQEPALRFINRCRTKGGEWRWLSWVAVREGDRVYGSARDVQVQKEHEAALARTVAEHDRIVRNSRDLIMVIGMSGELLSVNAATHHTLGWQPDEMLGRKSIEFIHPEHQPPRRPNGHLVPERYQQPQIILNRIVCKNGSHRWISWSTMTENGLIYCQGRDVTAEREQAAALESAEESLRQSQKMEAVGQLTGGIAHDFNNLLAAITGSLEIMQRRIAGSRFEEIERYATAALHASRRAAALTHRLLAFSRRQALDPRAVDVNRLLAGIEDLIRRTVGPAITLERLTTPNLWTTLVDANQLENAILNLCINARDAMPDGGCITLATANEALDKRSVERLGTAPGAYVAIRVSDTGIGMSPEVAAKAFEPFFTTKPLGRGTGLGLSMVYGFVQQSGGQVRIASKRGRGTTLHLYLPRHDAGIPLDKLDAPVRTERRLARGASKTVLVVDDEPTVRLLVVEVLTEAGFSVLAADDSVGALQILQSPTRIDLLVADIGLPGGMNGRQVADAARLRRPTLKVLLITGYAENAVVGNDPLEADTAILTKPFEMDAFEGKVRSMLAV